ALEQPRDVARLRPPARRARTCELRDQVVQQLAEPQLPREQRLEAAYVAQAIAVAALRVRDQTREIERRWLCAHRWSGRRHRRHASERLRTGNRRAQRAAEEARRRGQPAPVVPLEPADDEQLFRARQRDVQQPRLVVLLAFVARAVEQRVGQIPLLGLAEPARGGPKSAV